MTPQEHKAFVQTALNYLLTEGVITDVGDGTVRLVMQEEVDEMIEILGGDPKEIKELIQEALK